jgi:hypothetical protein
MNNVILNLNRFIRNKTLIIASATLMLSGVSAGVISIAQATPVAAASCAAQDQAPETNIIYCGLSGNNDATYTNSFKNYYYNGDGHYSAGNLQAIYASVGFKTGMFTSGSWRLGTSYNDGTIKVDGNVVGQNAQIASRCYAHSSGYCNPATQYTKIYENGNTDIETRNATWFFDTSSTSKQALVHLDGNGVADFAMWTQCGNLLMFTTPPKPPTPPTPPTPPVSSLICSELDQTSSQEGDTYSYTFTVKAAVVNTSNIHYAIDFGDNVTGSSDVTNGASQATFVHQYVQLEANKLYTIKAIINSQPQVAACQIDIQIPGKTVAKTLVCTAITAQSGDQKTFTFTAQAQTTNTTIDTYSFDFGDSVKLTQASNVATHTYADNVTDATASFVATGPIGTTPVIPACSTPIHRTHTAPLALVRTGPGSTFAIIASTSGIGMAIHQVILRRKQNA